MKLAICPQKVPVEPGKYCLLPPQESLTDGDGALLYEKAIRMLPDRAGDEQIRKWLDMPIDQLPVEQVEQGLEQYVESLKCAVRAVRCRQPGRPGDATADSDGNRRLAFAIRLWARLEVARDGYDGAILALQTGFGVAQHFNQSPTLVHVLVGVAIGRVMSSEVEELVQREGSPNLYPALARLPKPFMDVEKAVEIEIASSGLQDKVPNSLKEAHDRVRGLVKRFDTHLVALQCVEAIRSYAASHGGQLPGALADITEVSVPRDPISGEPFGYTRTGATAVLESAIPEGGDEAERIRYVIVVKN